MKTLAAVAAILSVLSCGKQSSNEPDHQDKMATVYHAICQLTNAQGAAVLCIDFPLNSPGNSSSCTTDEKQHYASFGVTGAEYLSVDAPGSTSCGLTNPSEKWPPNCGLKDRVVHYYLEQFPSNAFQNDCISRDGFPFPSGEN